MQDSMTTAIVDSCPLSVCFTVKHIGVNKIMGKEEEPRLEISVKWFDQWKFDWECTETTWKQVAEKLNGPIVKGVALGTGIAIGIGVSVYGFVQIDKALNPALRSTPIEALPPKR
jgi:hypothetical protein